MTDPEGSKVTPDFVCNQLKESLIFDAATNKLVLNTAGKLPVSGEYSGRITLYDESGANTVYQVKFWIDCGNGSKDQSGLEFIGKDGKSVWTPTVKNEKKLAIP